MNCALVTGVPTWALPICPLGDEHPASMERIDRLGHDTGGVARDIRHDAHREYAADVRAPDQERIGIAQELRGALLAGIRGAGVRRRDAVGLHDRLDERVVGLGRSEEHTSELQSLMRISYAVFCLKKKNKIKLH